MEADLLNAAFAKVKAVADGLSLPCYWPNVALPTSPANVHLRISVLPTTPQVLTICSGGSRYQWILQVAIWVRDGVGIVAPAQHIDSIRSAIPYNTVLTSSHGFKSIAAGEVLPAIAADGWYSTPVQFRLQTVY